MTARLVVQALTLKRSYRCHTCSPNRKSVVLVELQICFMLTARSSAQQSRASSRRLAFWIVCAILEAWMQSAYANNILNPLPERTEALLSAAVADAALQRLQA